ncbi:MAG TPA: phosphoribosylglycinamide formyltransferase [Candidatus Saccharimonadia bacterium]|nr:phosphoribosylglycinamide formyltransferase [Candidatus Saccharimonadia bacterium]
MTLRVAMLASGEGTNVQALLDASREGRLPIEIAGVFGDRPQARALERARKAGVPALALEPRDHFDRLAFDEALFAAIDGAQPDLVVCAGYMRLIETPVVERMAGRIINIHPSLLPAYQGLRTHARVLAAGDRVHGASVHFVTPQLDGGPVVSCVAIGVRDGDTPEMLAHRLQPHEHRLLIATVALIARRVVAATPFGVAVDGRLLDAPLQLAADDHLYDAAGFVA